MPLLPHNQSNADRTLRIVLGLLLLALALFGVVPGVWGIALKEWKGTGRATHSWIAAGLVVLILSTVVIGYGNWMGAQ